MKRIGMMLLVALAMPALGGPGQGAEIKDLIYGEVFPLTVQLKALDSEWRRVTVAGQATDYLQMYAAMFSGRSPAYYTKGETVTVGGETFIVAYQAQAQPFDLMAMMGRDAEPPAPEKLTPESVVTLSLLNLRAVGSLSDIRPFDLEQEIAESERLAERVSEALGEQFEEAASAAAEASSLSNLRQLALAMLMCAEDYDDALPPMENAEAMQEVLLPYVKNGDIFFHPETGEPYQPNPTLSGKRLADFADPAKTIAFYEPTPAEDGSRGAAFVDGHAKRVGPAEWERLKGISGIP